MFALYLLAILVQAGLLRMFSTVGGELTASEAYFATTSAVTLTGFPLKTPIHSYDAAGRLLFFVFTLLGTLYTLVVAGLAMARLLRLPFSDRQVLGSGVVLTLGLMTVGAVPFIASDSLDPPSALMLSLSAFGNSGLCFSEQAMRMHYWPLHAILLPLAVAGSLGLVVLMELPRLLRERTLSSHGRTALTMTAGAYLAFVAMFLVLHVLWAWSRELPIVGEGFLREVLAPASVQAVNGRTFGLPLSGGLESLPGFAPWLLTLAMIVGGCAGGTAGGLKLTTLVGLWAGARDLLAGRNPGRVPGAALLWTGIYASWFTLAFGLLVALEPHVASSRLLFDTISALSNVGLTERAMTIVSPGLDILTVTMVVGRLTPLAILWWMAARVDDAELAIG